MIHLSIETCDKIIVRTDLNRKNRFSLRVLCFSPTQARGGGRGVAIRKVNTRILHKRMYIARIVSYRNAIS